MPRPAEMRLSDLIYPPNALRDCGKEQQEDALRATDVAQPAIGAVSLGALRVLESFGLAADAAAGHSYGELTALCAAGRLDEPSFHALSRLRGQLMAAGHGDKGSMLAVPAPLADIEQICPKRSSTWSSPTAMRPAQAVLSGSNAEIDRAAEACRSRKLACKKLPVAAAFHSSLVADAAEPLLQALADIDLAAGTIPVFSNTTAADTRPRRPRQGSCWPGQLAQPVEFVAEIEAMHAAGIRTFVEVGPGSRLTGLVKAILGDHRHAVRGARRFRRQTFRHRRPGPLPGPTGRSRPWHRS